MLVNESVIFILINRKYEIDQDAIYIVIQPLFVILHPNCEIPRFHIIPQLII